MASQSITLLIRLGFKKKNYEYLYTTKSIMAQALYIRYESGQKKTSQEITLSIFKQDQCWMGFLNFQNIPNGKK